jgi:opacity protein-like surface antigen
MSHATLASRITPLVCALILMAIAAPAHALDGTFFLRGEIGSGDSDLDFRSALDESGSDRAHAVRAGYYFNRYLAAEAFYGKLYDERVAETRFGEFSLDASLTAAGIGVVGKKRFGEGRGFFVQGRGGFARYKGGTIVVSNPCARLLPCRFVTRTKDAATKPYLGIGAGYDFNDNVGVGVNYDAYRADFDGFEAETRTLTAALEIRF